MNNEELIMKGMDIQMNMERMEQPGRGGCRGMWHASVWQRLLSLFIHHHSSLFITNYSLLIIHFSLLIALSSCNIDADMKECPYNARLEYWYTGSGNANVLPDYIYTMHEFVFDSLGVLRQVNQIAGKKGIAAELNVPPGKYTLVTWANVDSASHVNRAEIGRTTKDEMKLYLDNPYKALKSEGAYHRNAERLYYGFATFQVNSRGVTRQRIECAPHEQRAPLCKF